MALSTLIEDTLAQVNIVREAFGYPRLTDLPDARPGDSQDCLYFRAMAPLGCTGVGGDGTMSFNSERMAKAVAQLWGVEMLNESSLTPPRHFARVIHQFDGNSDETRHYDV